MAKKKKVEIEPVEVVPQILPDEPVEVVLDPAEVLVSVIALGSFKDGAFKQDFEKLGYKTNWPDQEVRNIPARLYAKLMRRSGGKFALKGDKR